MSKFSKRVLRDKKNMFLNPLFLDNIFVLHDEDNISKSRACIIGPKDTPYEDGFYLFEFTFPENYPFEPLKAKFFTNDGRTRMHPNFYSCGKVCLSILGTWAGPGWTSCQTLSSVLLTIQSLFIKNPLHQEPGFQQNYSYKNVEYNKIIHHQNIKIAIVNMCENIPTGFEEFSPIIKEYAFKHKDNILKKTLGHTKDESLRSIWNQSLKTNYKDLNCKLTKMFESINILEEKIVDNIIDEFKKIDELTLNKVHTIFTKLDLQIDTQVILSILYIRDKIIVQNGVISLK